MTYTIRLTISQKIEAQVLLADAVAEKRQQIQRMKAVDLDTQFQEQTLSRLEDLLNVVEGGLFAVN